MDPTRDYNIIWYQLKGSTGWRPVWVLHDSDMQSRIASLHKTVFCSGCNLPILTPFYRCLKHIRDWCPACHTLLKMNKVCEFDVLKELDNELSAPLKQSRSIFLSADRSTPKKAIWLGNNRVGKVNVPREGIKGMKQFLDYEEQYVNDLKFKSSPFYDKAIISAFVLCKNYRPSCHSDKMLFNEDQIIDTSSLLQNVTIPTLPSLMTELMDQAKVKRNDDIYKIKYKSCKCCPKNSIHTACKKLSNKK